VVAVTGTNGKTSNVELTRQLWRMSGHHAASIGTLGVTTADDQVTTGLTTPDIVTFLSNMAGLAREGVTHAAFEASSHGLSQYRTEGLPVQAAAFTNFSRDHLDYHGTMEAYFEAKMRLFSEVLEADGTAVIWADDPKSEEVARRCEARGIRCLTVGRKGETLRLLGREPSQLGQKLTIEAEGKQRSLTIPLIGAYQAANVMTAAALVLATGGELAQTLANLARVQPVRGRLERAVITRAGAPVYVDYAHTGDALESAIEALRPHAKGRLITVFGAGGDRDIGKRPEMGRRRGAHVGSRYRHRRQSAVREPGGDSPRYPRRRSRSARSAGPARGNRRGRCRGRPRRHHPARRQRPRAGPDRRRHGPPVRRL
jgi:UDP-N-acetylmuramoyl-L-alanyl-D-glutamate--2,6-diaminopimelate ligase